MTRNLIINTQFGGQGHATVDYLRQEIAFFRNAAGGNGGTRRLRLRTRPEQSLSTAATTAPAATRPAVSFAGFPPTAGGQPHPQPRRRRRERLDQSGWLTRWLLT